jgi:hypothetical protein
MSLGGGSPAQSGARGKAKAAMDTRITGRITNWLQEASRLSFRGQAGSTARLEWLEDHCSEEFLFLHLHDETVVDRRAHASLLGIGMTR